MCALVVIHSGGVYNLWLPKHMLLRKEPNMDHRYIYDLHKSYALNRSVCNLFLDLLGEVRVTHQRLLSYELWT